MENVCSERITANNCDNNKDISHCFDILGLIEADLRIAVVGITTMISGNEK